jgi:Uma2 family endonuclease
MTVAERPGLMTTEQLLALPDDGKQRWLIRGELREKEMTRRNYGHSRIEAKIAYLLRHWIGGQSGARGTVVVGEAGVRLSRNPDTIVGVDVAYISAETVASNPDEAKFLDAIPVLVVEVLSPSDKQEEITEKVEQYLDAGVKVVWLVEPTFKTVTVYRADSKPRLFNADETIGADPDLPGFVVPVEEVFLP